MPFPAVIFDLDGTLLETLADIAWASNHALVQLGFAAHEREEYRELVGEGVRRLFWKALPEAARDEGTIDRCCVAFRQAYAAHWNVDTRPYEGVEELLAELQHRGVIMAVLSNKPHDFTCQCVDAYFPTVPFRSVLGQREGVPRKPDPAAALEIAEACGLAAERLLYLGDTATDVTTALAAGMYSVGALWGFRAREELVAAGAQALIARPLELLRFFGDPR